LIELAAMADELSGAPSPESFRRRVTDDLDRLRVEAGACTVHLVLRWGARLDQQMVFHGSSVDVDVEALADDLDRTDGWAARVVAAGVSTVAVEDASPDLGHVMSSRAISALWVVGGARSLPGSSHVVFAFSARPRELASAEATALAIHSTLLMSRSISRLALFEWDDLVSHQDALERSFLFETDASGELVRWPYPIVDGDRRLAAQMVPGDRRAVAEVVDSVTGGATTSYELIVRRAVDPMASQTMRLLARRSPRGGVEGIVLPPSLPVSVLPDDVSSRLTEREREVARLIAAGYRVRQVGERLYLSQNTVRNHLKNIFAKLGVSSQSALIALINEPTRHARPDLAST
jgi:DNA-binding CsgD family transcriptional regulator